jgi:phenylalanyl-tRNA synthetase beta chain
MPLIEINKKDLEKILNKKLDEKQLDDLMQYTKAGIEKRDGDTITLEIKDSNRPDMLSVEGIGRELLGVIGKEKGLAAYKASKSNYEVVIDKKVGKVRPEIVCAVVKDLKLDNHGIKQLIQLQEKLCEGFGRKRKEAAIGIYDFDKIKWPVHYTTFKSDEIKFVPLEMNQALSPRQILQMNEKGKEYAHLLEGAENYPFIIDSDKNVLSMPPIINSDYTGKVTENTKNVFVEVTGFNFDRISQSLNIILAALADRKGKVFSVSLKNKCITPVFRNKKKNVALSDISSRLGIELKPAEIVKILEKARYSAKIKKDKVEVEIPFYRTDVIHAVDIIEDIAIAYGYQNIPAEEPMVATIGSMLPETAKTEKVARILVGLGLHELATFNMTNKEDLFKKMNLNTNGIIEIENPVSSTYSCLRSALIPSLMAVLGQNTTSEYPQKIFEIGRTVAVSDKAENKADEKTKLAVAVSYSAAGFTEIMQIIDYLLSSLKLGYKINSTQHGSFIDGRTAELIINNKPIGIFGEIHPKVLESWKLEMPVVAAEIDLTELMKLF